MLTGVHRLHRVEPPSEVLFAEATGGTLVFTDRNAELFSLKIIQSVCPENLQEVNPVFLMSEQLQFGSEPPQFCPELLLERLIKGRKRTNRSSGDPHDLEAV